MLKFSDVKKSKKVIQLRPKIEFYFSYSYSPGSESEITHAHGIFNNSFIFCTRLGTSSNWRLDFISENILSDYDIAIISEITLHVLKSQFDLNSEIVLGNQAKFIDAKYKIHSKRNRIIFKLNGDKIQKNNLQLDFSFSQNIYIERFVKNLSSLKNTVSFFHSICQEKNFNHIFQVMKQIFSKRVFLSQEKFVFVMNSISECNAIVEFIRMVNSKNIWVDLIKFLNGSQSFENKDNQTSEFFTIIRSFKRSSISPIIKFPNSLFTLKYMAYRSSLSNFSLYFGSLQIIRIDMYENDQEQIDQFYSILKILYMILGKVNVIDALLKHKLSII